jgi:flagellar L-ring protein precursor FlgH
MKRTALILLAAWGSISVVCAQDLRENYSRSLFADQKANHVGDAVMIYIVETSSASNNATTTTSRVSDLELSATGTISKSLPEVAANIGSTNSFKGSGATTAGGSVTAKISARVDSVLANGNLVVHGNRMITINGEEQVISISGIIRPSDIQSDNSVYSYNISDAVISMKGNGSVSHAQEPGLLTKFFHWLF